MSVLHLWGRRGYSVRCWVVVCLWDTEALTVPCQHIPVLWEHDPRALKWFVFTSFNQQELFNVTSNVLFCILDVWLDFICIVVFPLLSHGINFHCNRHIRNYTHYRLVNFRFKHRGLNKPAPLSSWIHADVVWLFSLINFQAQLLVFVEEHFGFQPAWWSQFQYGTNVFSFLVELQLKIKER